MSPARPASPAPSGSASPGIASVTVRRIRLGGGAEAPRADEIAVEAPLEIRFGGRAATVLMRTPGDDEDLVSGFLLSEGLVTSADDLVRISRPPASAPGEEGNVVDVELLPSPTRPELDRPLYSSSSCGVCGKRSIASLEIPVEASRSHLRVRADVVASLPERLRLAQSTFDRTGGVHAAGLFTPDGTLVTCREDVGRHNAVDKVLGRALAERRLPLDERILAVSGRISFELAQKAIVGGIPVLVAVGAPSSLAVTIADRYGLTLVGFVRAGSFNVYTHPQRVIA